MQDLSADAEKWKGFLTLAAQKQEAIREAFKDWIFKDPERRADLVKVYNERFNSIVAANSAVPPKRNTATGAK